MGTPVRACFLYSARLRVVHCAVVGAAAYQKGAMKEVQ